MVRKLDDDNFTFTYAETSETWSADHCRVLYTISKYAETARKAQERERWVRQIALLVLLYEGIEAGCLKFDYAPNLVWISFKNSTERRWLRISQEAKSVIDDLWEGRLLNGIKLPSIDYQPVVGYQVSTKGMAIIRMMPDKLKREVDKFIYPPHQYGSSLLQVHYDGKAFVLTSGGFVKESAITESEDVSYVSSPFIPPCLRSKSTVRMEPTCNKLRATESANGQCMMMKRSKESIVLSQVHAIVGEWMPFGANQIAALIERLGAMERCQGGLFSSKIDENPTQTHFEVPPGLTQAKILDFDSIDFINFEAEINFPESDGIIQIENFGMHLHVSGVLLYGVKIEAIMDRSERDIPFDLLSRLLVDVHQDSSEIIRDLLSRYQLRILDMLFMGRASQRNKYNLIMASGIEPKLPASKYLDKGDRENELKQVLGEIYACFDVTRDDLLFLGRDGALFCGPNAHKYDSILTTFMGLNSRDTFIRNFFVRTFVLDDTLGKLRKMIRNYQKDPNTVGFVKRQLSHAAHNTVLLIESLQYLLESVEDLELPPVPIETAGNRLFKSLSLMERKNNILIRCKDSIKLIEKLRTQLDVLQMKFEAITKRQLDEVFRQVDLNTKQIVDSTLAHDRIHFQADIVRMLFAGALAFDIVDRLSGGSLNIPNPKWFVDWIRTPLVDTPALFFALNLVWFYTLWRGLNWWTEKRQSVNSASVHLRAHVDKRIDVSRLREALTKKRLVAERFEYDGTTPQATSFTWIENAFPSRSAVTLVELIVDEKIQILRSIRLQVNCTVEEAKPQNMRKRDNDDEQEDKERHLLKASSSLRIISENEVLEKFTDLLQREGVYPHKAEPLARLGTIRNMDVGQIRARCRRRTSLLLKQLHPNAQQ